MFREVPHISIPFFSASIIIFHMLSLYFEKQEQTHMKKQKKLKDQLKSAKRMLVSNMDPLMVEVVKEIVREDMKQEIAQMRNSDEGCS
jgi:polyhydroxyalkanoate synthesis regulator protein